MSMAKEGGSTSEMNITQIDGDANMEEVGVLGNQSQAPLPPKPDNEKKRIATGRTAAVWEHFREPYEKNNWPYTSCKYCNREYKCHPKKNGTTSLNTHAEKCTLNPNNQDKKQPKLELKSTNKLKAWSFDQKKCRDAVAKMIVLDELPFRHVEGEGFRLLMSTCCPMFNVPSRTTITKDVFELLYVREKETLKQTLKIGSPRVSLTTDTWTSNQAINYMCLTAHFIDENWILNKKILNFCPINSHRGEDIGRAVETCLLEWEIDRIMCVTVDNASSNDTAITSLRRKLANKDNVLGGRYMHMRCTAHIINLVVTDGLQMVGQSVDRVRAAVRYVKQSPARVDRFKTCVETEKIVSNSGLSLDVATRWNSTYLMLNSASKFERAFERLAEVDHFYKTEMENKLRKGDTEPLGLPTDQDWIKVRRLNKFLKHFFELTVQVSGSHYVTANILLDEISDTCELLKKGQNCDDLELREISKKMQLKYDKYWGDIDKLNLVIFLAPVFDPRHKFEFVLYVIDRMYEIETAELLKNKVTSVLHELFNEYKEKYSSATTSNAGSRVVETPTLSQNDCEPMFLSQKAVMSYEFKKRKASKEGTLKSELDRYLTEEFSEEDEENFKILDWWKSNCHRYPIVSKLARDILAIPISTVASESAFSTGGRVLNDFRSSMSPRIVQSLVCCQDWLRTKRSRMTLEEDINDIEALEEDFKKLVVEPSLML